MATMLAPAPGEAVELRLEVPQGQVFSYDVDVRSALTKNAQNAVRSELLSQ